MVFIIILAGLFLLIPAILFLTLFMENILFLDSLILSVAGAIWIRSVTGIHPVFCILCGICLLAGSILLYTQRHMFWIFTVTSTIAWGSMIPELYTEFDKGQWSALVDSVTVMDKKRMVWKLTSGMEVES